MAVTSAQVAVGSAATSLGPAETGTTPGGTRLYLRNSGATDVFLGGPGVTTATGFTFASGTTLSPSVLLTNGEELFAVATVSGTVQVLRTGV